MSISVENLSFAYGKHVVLDGVNFTAQDGEVLSVIGPNGAGKSTLFRCMLGLLKPTDGAVVVNQRSISELSISELAQNIAYVPQSHTPVFNYSVLDVVMMGTISQVGKLSSPKEAQRQTALEVLENLSISELKDRGYQNISGGERQLVLIARAMAQKARILIMDEPTASLDFGNGIRVMETVKRLSRQGYCIIQSTHDPNQAYRYSDRILALSEGKILSFDTPQNVICNEVVSKLYGTDIDVLEMNDKNLRVCVKAAD